MRIRDVSFELWRRRAFPALALCLGLVAAPGCPSACRDAPAPVEVTPPAAVEPDPEPTEFVNDRVFRLDTRDDLCVNRSEGMPEGCLQIVGGGRMLMGAQRRDPSAPGYDEFAGDDEAPPHWVEISPFALHFHEVRTWQYQKCVKTGGCSEDDVATDGYFYNYGKGQRDPQPSTTHRKVDQGRLSHPINGVSWFGARRYCEWIGARLPTEAEREFAARGPEGRRYPWGEDEPSLEHAVFGPTRARLGTSFDELFGSRTPTPIYHLAGNVWEWTADWYAPDYYARSPTKDPAGPAEGRARVIRGGGWEDDDPRTLRAAYRAAMPPETRAHDIGFRCARDVE